MKTILLDTDAGVDDILALMLLLRCPDLARLLAITVVSGNIGSAQAIANIRRGLAAMERYTDGGSADTSGLILAAGADRPLARPLMTATEVHGPDGLGGIAAMRDAAGSPVYPEADAPLDPRAAPDLILDLAAERPGEITVLAIGPLTNLALARRRDPERFGMLREIVVMGGAFRYDGNTAPTTEFNIHVDPEAAQEVLLGGVPITLVPLDCSEQTRLRRDEVQGGGPVRRFVRDITGFTMEFHRLYEGFDGAFHHDPLAAGIAMDPSFATGVHTRVMVETRGEHTSGQTVAGLRPDRPLLPGEPNAFVCLQPEADRFEAFFRARVLRE